MTLVRDKSDDRPWRAFLVGLIALLLCVLAGTIILLVVPVIGLSGGDRPAIAVMIAGVPIGAFTALFLTPPTRWILSVGEDDEPILKAVGLTRATALRPAYRLTDVDGCSIGKVHRRPRFGLLPLAGWTLCDDEGETLLRADSHPRAAVMFRAAHVTGVAASNNLGWHMVHPVDGLIARFTPENGGSFLLERVHENTDQHADMWWHAIVLAVFCVAPHT